MIFPRFGLSRLASGEDSVINAYHVFLALAVLFILFGGWRLMASDFEPTNLLVFGIGIVLAAGTLSRMGKERHEGRGKPDRDDDHAGDMRRRGATTLRPLHIKVRLAMAGNPAAGC